MVSRSSSWVENLLKLNPPEEVAKSEKVKAEAESLLAKFAERQTKRENEGLPTVAILGHGVSGKDTFAKMLAERFEGSFAGIGTSDILLRLLGAFKPSLANSVRENKRQEECRQYLAKFGDCIRAEDPAAIVGMTLAVTDFAVGIRRGPEFWSAWESELLDIVFWLHRQGVPNDTTLTISEEDIFELGKKHVDRVFWVNNSGTLGELHARATALYYPIANFKRN